MTTDRKPFDIGNVSARKVVFRSQWNRPLALVLDARPDEERRNDPTYHDEYCATDLYVDDPDGKWFAFWNEDCFQPSVYVVRADSFESAYEVFIEEFGAKACGVIEPNENVSNYGDGATVDSLLESGVLTWTANGIIDTEAIRGEEITLTSILA